MSFFLFTTFIFVTPCCIICLLLFVWYFVFKLSFSYVFSLLFSGVFSNVIHYSITIVKEICCLWCHFVLHSQLTHFCLFKFSQLLSCGKERSVISCFQIKLFSSKLRLDFCRSLMSALPQCGLLSQTAAGNQANSKLKVLKWPHNYSQSPVFGLAVLHSTRSEISRFCMSKHGEGKSLISFCYTYQYIVEIISSK